MDGITMREHGEGAISVLSVRGELDVWSGPGLGDYLTVLSIVGRDRVVLDLGELRFCDAFGVGVLVHGVAGARARNGWLRLAGANRQVSRVLVLSGAAGGLPMFASVADAVVGKQGGPRRMSL